MTPEKLAEVGITPEKIAGWKQQYGKISFLMLGGDRPYVFRIFTRQEWKQVQAEVEKGVEAQDAVCRRAVIFPGNFGMDMLLAPAGDIATLSEAAMRLSGFDLSQVANAVEL